MSTPIEELWLKGKEITDVVDVYSYMARRYNLPNYKYFDVSCLAIPDLDKIPEHTRSFLTGHKRVLGIANQWPGSIASIVFRDLEKKDFCTYTYSRGIAYGLPCTAISFGDPLVVVEGLKDRDCIAQITPNVVAMCGSTLSELMREVLLTVTNNFILLYDNDDTGKKQKYHDKKILELKGSTVRLASHPDGIKDAGSIIDLEFQGQWSDSEYLKSYYQSQLEVMGVIRC